MEGKKEENFLVITDGQSVIVEIKDDDNLQLPKAIVSEKSTLNIFKKTNKQLIIKFPFEECFISGVNINSTIKFSDKQTVLVNIGKFDRTLFNVFNLSLNVHDKYFKRIQISELNNKLISNDELKIITETAQSLETVEFESHKDHKRSQSFSIPVSITVFKPIPNTISTNRKRSASCPVIPTR